MFIVALVLILRLADDINATNWELIPSVVKNDSENSKIVNTPRFINVAPNSEFKEDIADLFSNFLPISKFQDVISDFENVYGNKTTTSSVLPPAIIMKKSNIIVSTDNSNSGSYTSYSGAYQAIKIDVGLASELETFPNYRPKIYFEVTNNQAQTTLLLFKCEDTQGILFTMWPLKSLLAAGETTVVTVTLWTKANSEGFQDQVTLSAISISTKWEKSVLVYVNNNKNLEYNRPSISHEILTDCYRVLAGNCQDASWTTEITVQDADSGLLRIVSEPSGIHFPYGFLIGTKSSVKGYYTSSCCRSSVKITATDLKINMVTTEISGYELKAWIIALIVVGAIILLAIIIALIIWLVKKKQKGSVDLPVYRGPSTSATT